MDPKTLGSPTGKSESRGIRNGMAVGEKRERERQGRQDKIGGELISSSITVLRLAAHRRHFRGRGATPLPIGATSACYNRRRKWPTRRRNVEKEDTEKLCRIRSN